MSVFKRPESTRYVVEVRWRGLPRLKLSTGNTNKSRAAAMERTLHALRDVGRYDVLRLLGEGKLRLADVHEHYLRDPAVLSALYADGLQDPSAAVKVALEGVSRWPTSTILMNNVAYALLLAGRWEEAGRYLDAIDESQIPVERRVYVTATKGLLALWRGDMVEGHRLYEQAAAIANREALREKVKAKRDLEVANAILRLGGSKPDAVRLLRRASEAGARAEPYVSHALRTLRLLSAGKDDSRGA